MINNMNAIRNWLLKVIEVLKIIQEIFKGERKDEEDIDKIS